MLNKLKNESFEWAKKKYLQLFFFNITIMLLVLLNAADYFDPIYKISINFIILTGLVLSIFLLGAKSKVMFFISLFFLGVSFVFESLRIYVWSERSGIYMFDGLIFGIGLLIKETIKDKKIK